MLVIHRKIKWLLVFSVVSLGIASWLILYGKDSLEQAGNRLSLTHETVACLQQLSYSVSLSAPVQSIQQQADTLVRLTHDNKDQPSRLAALQHYLAQPSIDRSAILSLLSSM